MKSRSPVVELPRRFARADQQRFGNIHGPGVEAGLHLHEADPRLLIASQYRGLDRRGTTPAGQQRGMNVKAAARRYVEGSLRQYQSVRRNNHNIRLERRKLCEDPVVAQGLRLQYLDALLERVALDRARRQFLAAAGRPVRLGEDGHRDNA